LLEREAERVADLLLAHAEHHSAHARAAAHEAILEGGGELISDLLGPSPSDVLGRTVAA
jgi:hypothetical protein